MNDLFYLYDEKENPEKRRSLLAKITVIGAYIKRRGNLIFIREKTETIDTTELALCMEESFSNLKLMGVECEADIPKGSKIFTQDAILVYDFFEKVMETAIDDMSFVWLKAPLQIFGIPVKAAPLRMAYGALSSASERRVDKRDNILFILRNGTVRMDDLPVLFFDIGCVSFPYIP